MPFSAPLSAEEPMSLASLITGSNCLKTCGMEDVQFAARRASDLFVTIRVCAVVLTSLLALFFILMIALRIYTLNMRKKRSSICRGNEHFISRELKEDRKCCCSSSSSRPIPPKLSHCAELPNSRDTTAAATPLPIPPPSICCSRSAEDEGDGNAEKPNLLFSHCQFENSQKQHFNNLSDYLLAKRMTANVGTIN